LFGPLTYLNLKHLNITRFTTIRFKPNIRERNLVVKRDPTVLLNYRHCNVDRSIGTSWLLHGDNCHLAHISSTNDSLTHSRTQSITFGRLLICADVTLALTLECNWRQPTDIRREETRVSVRMKSFWTLQPAGTERTKWFIARYTLHNDVKLNVDTR